MLELIVKRVESIVKWCVRIAVAAFVLFLLTIGSFLSVKSLTDLLPVSSEVVAIAVKRGLSILFFSSSAIFILPILLPPLYQSKNHIWKQTYNLTSYLSLYYVYMISSNFIQLPKFSANQVVVAKSITFIITVPIFNWLGRQWAKEKVADFSARPGTVGELLITRFAVAIMYALLSIFFLFGAGLISSLLTIL